MSQQINVKKNSKQKTPNKQKTTEDKKQTSKQKTPNKQKTTEDKKQTSKQKTLNKESQDLLNVKFGNLSIDNHKEFADKCGNLGDYFSEINDEVTYDLYMWFKNDFNIHLLSRSLSEIGNKVIVITGNAGTGKTTFVELIKKYLGAVTIEHNTVIDDKFTDTPFLILAESLLEFEIPLNESKIDRTYIVDTNNFKLIKPSIYPMIVFNFHDNRFRTDKVDWNDDHFECLDDWLGSTFMITDLALTE